LDKGVGELMKSLTKQNISKIWLLKLMSKHKQMRLISKMISNMKLTKSYSLEVHINGDQVNIQYKGKEFGLKQLASVNRDGVFEGGGQKILLKNSRIRHSFEVGVNKWTILLKGGSFGWYTAYEIKEKLNDTSSLIVDEIISYLLSKDYDRDDADFVWQYALEIITNILYNTNIDTNIKFGLLDVIKELK